MKVLTEGTKTGLCNICEVLGPLTLDHIPPRGSVDVGRVKIRTLTQTLEPLPSLHRHAQNGVQFRSLCSQCNNGRLGARFDPALNRFSRKVAQILRVRQRLTLPRYVDVECRPQRLARAVIGHLLAAEIRPNMHDRPRSAPMLDAMRSYFLDEQVDMPGCLRLYFWPYAARRQAILRAVGVLSAGEIVIGDFLKYFPCAFWLTHEAPPVVTRALVEREVQVRSARFDDVKRIRVPTIATNTLRPDWPERPDDQEILVIHEGICFVTDPA